MYSDYNGIKVEIKNRKITRKSPSTWKLNSILETNLWVKENTSREIKADIELHEYENTTYQICGMPLKHC